MQKYKVVMWAALTIIMFADAMLFGAQSSDFRGVFDAQTQEISNKMVALRLTMVEYTNALQQKLLKAKEKNRELEAIIKQLRPESPTGRREKLCRQINKIDFNNRDDALIRLRAFAVLSKSLEEERKCERNTRQLSASLALGNLALGQGNLVPSASGKSVSFSLGNQQATLNANSSSLSLPAVYSPYNIRVKEVGQHKT